MRGIGLRQPRHIRRRVQAGKLGRPLVGSRTTWPVRLPLAIKRLTCARLNPVTFLRNRLIVPRSPLPNFR